MLSVALSGNSFFEKASSLLRDNGLLAFLACASRGVDNGERDDYKCVNETATIFAVSAGGWMRRMSSGGRQSCCGRRGSYV